MSQQTMPGYIYGTSIVPHAPISMRHFFVFLATFPLLFLLLGASPVQAARRMDYEVQLLFYDANGNSISGREALWIMNGHGAGFRSDSLIDPSSLRELVFLPLHVDTTNHLSFTPIHSSPVALEVNWPMSTRGYSMLILDNGGAGFTSAGTVNFTYLAAKNVKRRLDLGLAARPDYRPSIAFQNAYEQATQDIKIADASSNQSVRGKYGQRALDQLAVANDLMLSEYGIQYVQAHSATSHPWLGLTDDHLPYYAADFRLANTLTHPYGWIRIVFHKDEPPSHYLAAVQYAKSVGLKVMGEPIDSAGARRYNASEYHDRIAAYVDYFREHGNLIDAWEVGNEVNGEWLGTGVPGKVADAARYAHQHSNALVEVTLFWQIGTGPTPENSTFNWAYEHLMPSVLQNIDVILLSTYPDGAPMGLAFDEVFQTLHAAFPHQKIGIGELGYADDGSNYGWWYCNQSDRIAAQACVADQFYRASPGYDNSVDGVFWWFFSEDFQQHPGLRDIVSDVRNALCCVAG